jgi:hypothetical protein
MKTTSSGCLPGVFGESIVTVGLMRLRPAPGCFPPLSGRGMAQEGQQREDEERFCVEVDVNQMLRADWEHLAGPIIV